MERPLSLSIKLRICIAQAATASALKEPLLALFIANAESEADRGHLQKAKEWLKYA